MSDMRGVIRSDSADVHPYRAIARGEVLNLARLRVKKLHSPLLRSGHAGAHVWN